MYATMEEQWLILITQTIRIFLFYHVKKEVCICAFLRDKNNNIIAHIYIYIYIYICVCVCKYNTGGWWLRLPYVYVRGVHEKKGWEPLP